MFTYNIIKLHVAIIVLLVNAIMLHVNKSRVNITMLHVDIIHHAVTKQNKREKKNLHVLHGRICGKEVEKLRMT